MHIDLAYPISAETGPLTRLSFRRATARDLREMAKHPESDPVGASVLLVARLSGLTEVQVDDMDAEDFLRASEAAAGFLPQKVSNPVT